MLYVLLTSSLHKNHNPATKRTNIQMDFSDSRIRTQPRDMKKIQNTTQNNQWIFQIQSLAAPPWSISTTNNVDLSLGVAATTITTIRSTTTNNNVDLSLPEVTKKSQKLKLLIGAPELYPALVGLNVVPHCQPPQPRFEEVAESRKHVERERMRKRIRLKMSSVYHGTLENKVHLKPCHMASCYHATSH